MRAFLSLLENRLNKFLKENNSGKNLIIVNSYDKIAPIAAVLKKALNNPVYKANILCFKMRIPEELSTLGERVRTSEDYLTADDYARIDNYVFSSVSKDWDRKSLGDLKNIFMNRDIKLGRLAEYDFQLYLLIRVKALATCARAVNDGNYRAIFIIDTNDELEGLDRLLCRHYGVTTGCLIVGKRTPPARIARREISKVFSSVIDNLAFLLVKGKGAKLIDANLARSLGTIKKKGFIPALFEDGLRIRLECLFKKGGYVAFKVAPDAPRYRAQATKGFDAEVLADRFVFAGIKYWELVENRVKGIIRNDFGRCRKNIDILFKAHAKLRLKSVILRNDVKEAEKTAVLAAKKNDIPTLVAQHGILAEPNGHNFIFADKVAVWGERAAEWYRRFGNSREKTTVVGNIRYDEINKKGNPAIINPKTRPTVTLFTTGVSALRQSSTVYDDTTENLIRDVIKAVKSLGGLDLIIKLHPNEDARIFSKLIDEKDRAITMLKNADSLKLLEETDLAVTIDSTVGLEAVIMGKPLVILNPFKRPDLLPYVEKRVAFGVYKSAELKSAIARALRDNSARETMNSARENFIKDFAYRFDGKTKERVLKLIDNF